MSIFIPLTLEDGVYWYNTTSILRFRISGNPDFGAEVSICESIPPTSVEIYLVKETPEQIIALISDVVTDWFPS